MDMADDFLVADKLQKSFGEFKAVNGVSFSIHANEIFGLLGPNGAGKTTTIRMCSTVLSPDAGDITIGGFSLRKQPEQARRLIGVCPQELALYEDLSALDNMVFFGELIGLSATDAKTQAMANLSLMELEQRAKNKVSKYSGGMKRRVNLAVALMGNPKMLFLDEPTVGIDPQSRNKIFETVNNLRQTGLTVLYTTHYMEEADRLCDRVAIMDGGKIIALDTPRRLKSQIGDPEKTTLEDVFLKMTGRSLRD
ncbi:MAG TPA: ABC transporter ATP-binding protein [Dehalococcoidales bacterium]|nr:ABC transporter ATP-binding protein [Dehalococcoidales bacterium]